jgi:1,4-alpha-glucan branching enzyme
MHFTHVELYAIFDHMKPTERGYQVENFFAPYHLMGSCDEVKSLIDRLHQEGIGVIVDWVLAHFHHTSRGRDYSSSLYEIDGTNLVAGGKTNWGTLFFDYSKPETKRLMQASALYWIEKMHVDGLRFDAVHGMLTHTGSLDQAALTFLKDLNQLVHARYPGVLMIAENTADSPVHTKPVEEGGVGFDLRWGIGLNKESEQYFHRPTHERSQSEVHYKFTHFMKELASREKEIFTQSHDDADTGGEHPGSTLYNLLPDRDRFANMRNYFAWQIFGPNRGHLIHMGDELGQQISWFERFQKRLPSVDWSLEESDDNRMLQRCVSDMIAFYRANSDFWSDGEQNFTLLDEWPASCALAYLRGDLLVIHNFSDKPFTAPPAVQQRQLTRLFTSDSKLYGGSGNYDNGLTIAANSTSVYKTKR